LLGAVLPTVEKTVLGWYHPKVGFSVVDSEQWWEVSFFPKPSERCGVWVYGTEGNGSGQWLQATHWPFGQLFLEEWFVQIGEGRLCCSSDCFVTRLVEVV
jgi:hypothetical protein